MCPVPWPPYTSTSPTSIPFQETGILVSGDWPLCEDKALSLIPKKPPPVLVAQTLSAFELTLPWDRGD